MYNFLLNIRMHSLNTEIVHIISSICCYLVNQKKRIMSSRAFFFLFYILLSSLRVPPPRYTLSFFSLFSHTHRHMSLYVLVYTMYDLMPSAMADF